MFGSGHRCPVAVLGCLALTTAALAWCGSPARPQGGGVTPPSPPPPQAVQPHPNVMALLSQGDKALGERPEEASALFRQALEKARALGDRAGEALALLGIGIVYSRQEQPHKAVEYWDQAVRTARAAGYRAGERRTLRNLSVHFKRHADHQKVIETNLQLLPHLKETGDVLGAADAHFSTALAYAALKQLAPAREHYEQAIPLFRQVGEKGGEGAALTNLGNLYSDLGQPERALALQHQALPLHRAAGQKQNEANAFDSIGNICRKTGRWQEGLYYHRQALALRRETGDRRGEAQAHVNLGRAYYGLDLFAAARERFELAGRMYREVGDKGGEAATLTSLGNTFRSIGEPLRALDAYERSLSLAQQAGTTTGVANALAGKAEAYGNVGRWQEALDYHRQALTLWREVRDARREAETLAEVGIAYYSLGEPIQALSHLQQAVDTSKAAASPDGEARALSGLALVYGSLRDPLKALEFYKKALPLHQKTRDRFGQAMTWNGMSGAYRTLEQPEKSLPSLQQALRLFRELKDRKNEAATLANIGVWHADQGRRQEALAYYRHALALYEATSDRDGVALAQIKLGSQAGSPRESIPHFRQALSHFRDVQHRDGQAQALEAISSAYRRAGDMDAAERAAREAAAIREEQIESLGGSPGAALTFQRQLLGTHLLHLDILLKRGKNVDAFAALQKTKGRTLLDLVRSGRVDVRRGMTAAEREREQALRQRAEQLGLRMIREGVQNEAGAKTRYAALKVELEQAERDLAAFTDALYARQPDLARRRAARTLTLAEVGRFLPEDTALLEYAHYHLRTQGETRETDATYLFVVTAAKGRARLAVHRVRSDCAAMKKRVGALRAACADPRRAYRSDARALYRLLVGPAAGQIAGKKRLVVCPESWGWKVPFAALHDGRRFLAERFEVAYAYSATGLEASLLAKSAPKRPRPTRTLLALANPHFGAGRRFGQVPGAPGHRPIELPSRPIELPSRPIELPSRAPAAGGRLAPLAGAQREARAIAKLFPGGADVYSGRAAREQVVAEVAGRYRYLHLASHAFVNDAAPLLSGVLLSDPQPGAPEDGLLTAREIFDTSLSADMVVLSACNTGRGEEKFGEGLVGLSWALFAAGVPTQVVSHWAVDDAATADLMTRFYGGIARGRPKGRALRDAALALRRDGRHGHPYYWAPFLLMGDWR